MATGIVQSDGRHMQPHDLDAEESLLGAMVVSPNAIPIATELVVEDDFYRDTHRLVFQARSATCTRSAKRSTPSP